MVKYLQQLKIKNNLSADEFARYLRSMKVEDFPSDIVDMINTTFRGDKEEYIKYATETVLSYAPGTSVDFVKRCLFLTEARDDTTSFLYYLNTYIDSMCKGGLYDMIMSAMCNDTKSVSTYKESRIVSAGLNEYGAPACTISISNLEDIIYVYLDSFTFKPYPTVLQDDTAFRESSNGYLCNFYTSLGIITFELHLKDVVMKHKPEEFLEAIYDMICISLIQQHVFCSISSKDKHLPAQRYCFGKDNGYVTYITVDKLYSGQAYMHIYTLNTHKVLELPTKELPANMEITYDEKATYNAVLKEANVECAVIETIDTMET